MSVTRRSRYALSLVKYVAVLTSEQDFLPKLKQHLLSRILLMLRSENSEDQTHPSNPQDCDPNSVLFQHDRMFQHNLLRINYTTYDVRRSQDVVNAHTSHCNVMVFDEPSDDSGSGYNHPFKHARVLGTYHVNVVYVGPGMRGYQPRRMEFLWVRWYKNDAVEFNGWDMQKLDRIRFPPIAEGDSFGFIDPSTVLRGCHLIPAFARGRLHTDGKGMSHCARDASDWSEYYVNRYVYKDGTCGGL